MAICRRNPAAAMVLHQPSIGRQIATQAFAKQTPILKDSTEDNIAIPPYFKARNSCLESDVNAGIQDFPQFDSQGFAGCRTAHNFSHIGSHESHISPMPDCTAYASKLLNCNIT
jgi:hypothetical protein